MKGIGRDAVRRTRHGNRVKEDHREVGRATRGVVGGAGIQKRSWKGLD